MELVKHGSLLELIRRRVDEGVYFSDDEASRIIRSVLAAITYIHAKNIVHRDIKPRFYEFYVYLYKYTNFYRKYTYL